MNNSWVLVNLGKSLYDKEIKDSNKKIKKNKSDICLKCNNKIKPGNYLLNLIESGIFCNDCSDKTKFSNLKLLEQEIRLLKHIKNTEYDNNLNVNNIITQKTDLNLYKKLSTYIKFYTNKELKSEKILFSSLNK